MEESKNIVKADFGKIEVKDIEGNAQYIDVRKAIGNQLYMQGADYVECHLGERIWNSEGLLELDDKEVAAVVKFTEGYPYLSRTAIRKAVGKE